MGPGRTDWTDKAAILRSCSAGIFFLIILSLDNRIHMCKICSQSPHRARARSSPAKIALIGKTIHEMAASAAAMLALPAMAAGLARCCSTPRHVPPSPSLSPLLGGCRNNYRAEIRPSLLGSSRPASQSCSAITLSEIRREET